MMRRSSASRDASADLLGRSGNLLRGLKNCAMPLKISQKAWDGQCRAAFPERCDIVKIGCVLSQLAEKRGATRACVVR